MTFLVPDARVPSLGNPGVCSGETRGLQVLSIIIWFVCCGVGRARTLK